LHVLERLLRKILMRHHARHLDPVGGPCGFARTAIYGITNLPQRSRCLHIVRRLSHFATSLDCKLVRPERDASRLTCDGRSPAAWLMPTGAFHDTIFTLSPSPTTDHHLHPVTGGHVDDVDASLQTLAKGHSPAARRPAVRPLPPLKDDHPGLGPRPRAGSTNRAAKHDRRDHSVVGDYVVGMRDHGVVDSARGLLPFNYRDATHVRHRRVRAASRGAGGVTLNSAPIDQPSSDQPQQGCR
jgi:hypothetical protein